MTQPTQLEVMRKRAFETISALRDEVFWYEDAKGLDSTSLKALLDETLDKLPLLREVSHV